MKQECNSLKILLCKCFSPLFSNSVLVYTFLRKTVFQFKYLQNRVRSLRYTTLSALTAHNYRFLLSASMDVSVNLAVLVKNRFSLTQNEHCPLIHYIYLLSNYLRCSTISFVHFLFGVINAAVFYTQSLGTVVNIIIGMIRFETL